MDEAKKSEKKAADDRAKMIQLCRESAIEHTQKLLEDEFEKAYDAFEKMYARWLLENPGSDPLKFKYAIGLKVMIRPGTTGDRKISALLGYGVKASAETKEEELSLQPKLPGSET